MKLNKVIKATLEAKERKELINHATNIDETISQDNFIGYVESLIDKALLAAIK